LEENSAIFETICDEGSVFTTLQDSGGSGMDKETADHHFETSKFKEIVMQSKDIIYYCLVKPKPQVLFVNGALEQYFGRGSVQPLALHQT